MNPRSTDYEADALTTMPSRRLFYVFRKIALPCFKVAPKDHNTIEPRSLLPYTHSKLNFLIWSAKVNVFSFLSNQLEAKSNGDNVPCFFNSSADTEGNFASRSARTFR